MFSYCDLKYLVSLSIFSVDGYVVYCIMHSDIDQGYKVFLVKIIIIIYCKYEIVDTLNYFISWIECWLIPESVGRFVCWPVGMLVYICWLVCWSVCQLVMGWPTVFF